MSDPSLLPTLASMARTLRISVVTLANLYRGKLTMQGCDEQLASWCRELLGDAGIELEVIGAPPPTGTFVVMSNHLSHYDIPVLFAAFERPLRMVAKAELFRIPVWGQALRASGFVPVDRSGNRARAKAAMDEAAKILHGGISVWIAPEGTRAEHPDPPLRKLKKGGFLLAVGTQTPVLPVGISGTEHTLPKHHWRVRRGAHVTVRFGTPIPSGPNDESSLAPLMQKTYDAISALAWPK